MLLQFDEGADKEQAEAIRRELAMLRARRFLRTLAVVQDIADALLTLPDLGGEPPRKSSCNILIVHAG